MTYILFDDKRHQLLPFTHTRAVADIRCGILTMRERWELCLQQTTGTLTEDYIQPIYGTDNDEFVNYINANIASSCAIAKAVMNLAKGHKLMDGETVVAAHCKKSASLSALQADFEPLTTQQIACNTFHIAHIWDIFALNDKAIREDFTLITSGKTSAPLPDGVTVSGKENVFLEPGAKINAGSVINATTGPVYLAKGAEIMEGCLVRGPLAMGENSALKMGAKVYGATTIGPGSKAGGEISNVVFFANSNKGHDGFLGNAVIGEWCNLGADTNCSNLKNNYDEIKIWDEHTGKSVKTNLTFCGVMMGDHSKCGINTMFNTGTVVGVSCNIYGSDFPEKFIPSFSWGGSGGMVTYDFNRAMETAGRMMQRRNKHLTAPEKEMLQHVFDARKK
ncbi:MAG: GlmU family protein [Taibaiella sp.]|nr:GlmU family protein [Taibaiella sp.]